MSLELVKARLAAAFNDKTPRVIMLTAGWGEGKTHQWREALHSAQSSKPAPRFAYVSLFGIGSLADARKRLTDEFVAGITVPNQEGTVGSLVSDFSSKTKYLQYVKLIPLIPVLGKAENLINDLSFLAVRDAVICIDDLERKGAGLTVADVLGLAAFLKEERRCRVVLIANDQKFTKPDKDAAQAFLEKVVDEHVHFSATVEEACDIGIDVTQSQTSAMLRKHIESFGVSNIRVVGRLNRLALQMEEAVSGVDQRVLAIGVLALVAFGLGHYIPGDRFPSIDFILRRQDAGWLRILHRNRGAQPDSAQEGQETAWDEMLTQLGGPGNDPFEVALADAVRAGFFTADLGRLARDLAQRLDARQLAEDFRTAWSGFWHSLKGEGPAVLDSLLDVTDRALPAIGPGDLRMAYDVFVAANREHDASALLERFIHAHRGHPEIFDRERSAFKEHFTGTFGAGLAAAAAQFILPTTTKEALERIDPNGWNPEDVAVVGNASVDELEALVRAAEGRDFRKYMRSLLMLASMAPDNPQVVATGGAFAERLRSWASADEITAIRLRQYLPPPAEQ